jgi:hypothetical protein
MRFGERLVGGDRDAVLLVTLGQDLEGHLGAASVEFEVAEFFDFEQIEQWATR